MPLPDLCIAPHEAGELSPDEPLCAPATHRVWGWSLFWGGYYLIRSVQKEDEESVLIARREKSNDSPLLQLVSDESSIPNRIRKGLFYRTLYFNAQGNLISSSDVWHNYLLLWPGLPRWISAHRPDGEFFQFWQGSGFKQRMFTFGLRQRIFSYWWATTSDSQIEHEVGAMLQDVDCDCAFAWRWAHTTERERISYLCRVRRGNLDECEQLLRAILWSEPTWSNNYGWMWRLYMDSSTSDHIVRLSEIYNDGGKYPLSIRLARLLEIVVEEFGLHRNSEIERKRTIHRIWNWNGGRWIIDVPTPSQHERLEARLHLCEWLHDKVAPEEIPFLLGDAT